MADLVKPEALIAKYPDSSPELSKLGMTYATFAHEAATLVALGEKEEIVARCVACGLPASAWPELTDAHQDFVSAQAHWSAARAFGVPDATFAPKLERLEFLRNEMLDQATFYFRGADDQKRLAETREGDSIPDTVADSRTLVPMIRPRVAEILDPGFVVAWLDEALNLAAEVEAAHATRTAEAAATPAGQPMRRVRDRAAARLHDLMRQVRDYGKHAFRKDPKLRTAFTSDQLRRRRRKSGSEQPAPQP